MPSSISIEDLEAACYRDLHVRDPILVRNFLRLVQVYAIAQVRKHAPPQEDAYVPGGDEDSHEHLAPGESDLKAEVTRCDKCLAVKDWEFFHADSEAPSKHRSTCRVCRGNLGGRPPRKAPPAPDKKYKCRPCGRFRVLDEFPPEKRENRSLPVACLACQPLTQKNLIP